MKSTRILIKGELAKFSIPYGTRQQLTYTLPPPSTIIGILKNIYDDDIDQFIFGYTFESEGIFTDSTTAYKQDKYNKIKYDKNNYQVKDIIQNQYLINPKLYLYTNITKEMTLNNPLTLGKSDCLAKILVNQIKEIDLINKKGQGFNQWTDLNIGCGIRKRVTTETIFNKKTDTYNQFYKILEKNIEFEYDKFYDEERQQNIFLWYYDKNNKEKIKCYID